METEMKADYDSQADAISITLSESGHWDDSVEVDDTYCHVAFSGGKAANIEFLYPEKALRFVGEAAAVAGVDPQLVEAAARAALAAPDREVKLEFSDGQYGSESVIG
ncbi:MAG: hypothetical protein JJE13_03505 [Thermoleophilia bacterium]|nr:hypothetical protein [Thermoleophilia bacterium]